MIVRVDYDLILAGVNHRLDRQNDAWHKQHSRIRFAIMANERFKVKLFADAVPAQIRND